MEKFSQALLARQQTLDRLDAIQRELNEGWQELRGHLARGCTASQAAQAHEIFISTCRNAVHQYKEMIALGVCREQARCVLPLGLYSEVYWTVSLQAAAHFIRLRTDSHAQWEIQQYAQAVRQVVAEVFPESLRALLREPAR